MNLLLLSNFIKKKKLAVIFKKNKEEVNSSQNFKNKNWLLLNVKFKTKNWLLFKLTSNV
jgi:hypothetical protein